MYYLFSWSFDRVHRGPRAVEHLGEVRLPDSQTTEQKHRVSNGAGAGGGDDDNPYADHFYVTRTGKNSWSAPQPRFLTKTRMESIGGIHIFENSARRIAYCMGDGDKDIYY